MDRSTQNMMVVDVPGDRLFREPYRPHTLHERGATGVRVRPVDAVVRALQCGDLLPACDVSREIMGVAAPAAPATSRRRRSTREG